MATPIYTVTGPNLTHTFKAGDYYGGYVTGGQIGVYSDYSGDTLINQSGFISANGGSGTATGIGGIGVELKQADTLENNTLIYGGSGFYAGNGGAGVSMIGGTLDNYTSTGALGMPGTGRAAVIQGGSSFGTGNGGAGVSLAGGDLNNVGHIYGGRGFLDSSQGTGNGGDGVDVSGGANVDNSGKIYGGLGLGLGGIGLLASGVGTAITNTGHIAGGGVYSQGGGTGGIGVELSGGASLTNMYGGALSGGNGSNNGPGGKTGPAGIAAYVGYHGTLTNEGKSGPVKVAAGGELYNEDGGTISDGQRITGVHASYFAVDLEGGQATFTGSGELGIAGVYLNGGTLTSSGTYLSSGIGGADIAFGNKDGTLILEGSSTFHPAFGAPNVTGFVSGDTIDVKYLNPSEVRADYSATLHSIYLDGPENVTTTLVFGGTFSPGEFQFNPDGSGGTDITLACFLRGTQIRTEVGEVAIEELRIGDRVMTLSGEAKPIRWIGHRRYAHQFVQDHRDVTPVCFRAGSLGQGLPLRDLSVSPEHAMYLDGVLVPAAALVNGDCIALASGFDDVLYFHLEFDEHVVVYAEGAPSESFVDDDSREMFDNSTQYHQLYPHAPRVPARFCAPRVEDGEALEVIRRLVAAQSVSIADGKQSPIPSNRWREASAIHSN
jgi:Hint domain